MHPAYSVILFTTASGAGYGLLVLMGIVGAYGLVEVDFWFGLIGYGLGLALVTIGLLSSTFHLGHPERAWRAFSQWHSSWLSKEGVAAVATYVPTGIAAIGWVFFESASGLFALAGVVSAALAAITVFCTGQIYATLPTIRQWHHPLTTPIYLALAMATGTMLLNLIGLALDGPALDFAFLVFVWLALAGVLKLRYWQLIDREPRRHTVEAATGLGHLGKVRPLDPPHSQPNYVMREMGYAIGRKHRDKLRRLVMILLFAVPFALTLIGLFVGDAAALVLAVLSTLSAGVGVVTERWLFFAEAEHVSMLYYGRDAA